MSNLPGMLAGGEGFRAPGSAGRVSGEPWREGGLAGDFSLVQGNGEQFFLFFNLARE